MDTPDDLLTVREVAAKLRVDEATVYRLIQQKKLRASRPTPRTTRVSVADLDSFRRHSFTMPETK